MEKEKGQDVVGYCLEIIPPQQNMDALLIGLEAAFDLRARLRAGLDLRQLGQLPLACVVV